MQRVLVLCTGNSCRSQMLHGYLAQDRSLEVASAGVDPHGLNPGAVAAMAEVGIDISGDSPSSDQRRPHGPGDRGQAQVHPNQVSGWKRQAQAGLEEVFAGATSRRQKDHEGHDANVTVERDFLSRGLGR